MTEYYTGTGGERRAWIFDPTNVPAEIADKLTYNVQFMGDEPDYETMLALVMDKLLDDLPPEQEEAVRLLYLANLSQHKAAEQIGVTHKTVKARADKGIAQLKRRLSDSVWLADMLQGIVPSETSKPLVSPDRITSVISALGHHRGKSNGTSK